MNVSVAWRYRIDAIIIGETTFFPSRTKSCMDQTRAPYGTITRSTPPFLRVYMHASMIDEASANMVFGSASRKRSSLDLGIGVYASICATISDESPDTSCQKQINLPTMRELRNTISPARISPHRSVARDAVLIGRPLSSCTTFACTRYASINREVVGSANCSHISLTMSVIIVDSI